MLLDAAGLYFRAFYGVPESITTPDGRPINAVRGFLDMTARLVATRRPGSLVACLDEDWRPAFRVVALPSYKAHRVAAGGGEDVPAALAAQVPILMQVLDALGIARVGAAGFEADDVIGTLAARARETVEVVSGDRDLMQVVRDDAPVRLLYIGRGLAKMQVFDEAGVRERYGVPPGGYADFATLRGDPSDGLPGVAGVGEKTAAALVTRFGSIERIRAAAEYGTEGFPAGSQARIQAAAEYLAAAPAVVRVRTDVPVGDVDATLRAGAADPEALVRLADEHGLDSTFDRTLTAIRRTVG
ncbi:MAG: 5'-3' exonuclease [Mycobacteriales bacterium]|nr:MAG: flap endonuclease [Pseudonocardiales bacterium]